MPVCDPNKNAPIPRGLVALVPAELDRLGVSQADRVAMQRWAKSYADDLAVPYFDPKTGAGLYRKWFGALPVVALVQCHSYTQQGDEQIPGAFHGVAVYRASDPAFYPDAPSAEGSSAGAVVAAIAIAALSAGAAIAVRRQRIERG